MAGRRAIPESDAFLGERLEAHVLSVLTEADDEPITGKEIAATIPPQTRRRQRLVYRHRDCSDCRHYRSEDVEEVVEGAEANYANVYQALTRLESRGRVVRIPDVRDRRRVAWLIAPGEAQNEPGPASVVELHLEPESVSRARMRLHNERGPAIRWSNGAEVWALHGVHVTERTVLEPESLTANDVHREPNVERRRVMLERMGLERYLETGDAEVVHTDDFGTLYRVRSVSLSDEDSPTMRQISRRLDRIGLMVVKVLNATPEPDGSFRDYLLIVDPDAYGGLTTARAAVASTWRVEDMRRDPSEWELAFADPNDYAPVIQT